MTPITFRLVRLILIDSFSPNRIVLFPVDGGAVLTGRNGRGKTSLLQLIPVFYGESPNRLVATETTRDNFVHYYLPRSTSYILFEYLRRDVPCLVALHASRDGHELRYQFLRTAYDQDLFVLPDGTTIVPAPDLRRHLRTRGIICSEQISSVTEYRAIIQGRLSGAEDRQARRRLIAEYSFVDGGHHLTHIEKLISGMFLRRTNFEDLQRMVVSCISDRTTPVTISLDPHKLEAWPRDYTAYRDIMNQAARLETLKGLDQRIEALDVELGRVHARYCRLDAHLADTEARLLEDQTATKALKEQEADSYRTQRDGLRDAEDLAQRAARALEEQVAALERQHENYSRQGIQAKAKLVAEEPANLALMTMVEARRTALLGAQQDISARYEQLVNEANRARNQREVELTNQDRALHAEYEPRFSLIQIACDNDISTLRSQHTVEEADLDQRINAAHAERGRWEQTAKHPTPSPDTERSLREKQTTRNQLEQRRETLDQERKRLAEVFDQAKRDHGKQDNEAERCRRHVDQLATCLDNLRQRARPPETSLLHFLRTTRPAWTGDIAKIIREDLLLRTDLQPDVIVPEPTEPSLYGVAVDLDQLESSLSANEAALQQEIHRAEDQLGTARAALGTAQQVAVAGLAARKKAEDALALHQSQMAQCQAALGNIRLEEQTAQRAVDESKKRNARDAVAQATAIGDQIASHEGVREALRDRLAANSAARREEGEKANRVLRAERDARSATIEQLRADLIGAMSAQIATLEAERSAALARHGVDTLTLQRIEQEYRDLQTKLREAQDATGLVREWRHWIEEQWARRAAHVAESTRIRVEEAKHHEAVETLDGAWRTREAALQSSVQQIVEALTALDRTRAMVRERRTILSTYPPDPDILALPYDTTWTIETLNAQANTGRREIDALFKEYRTDLAELKRAFCMHRDTPPDQYYDHVRKLLGPEAADRTWLPHFKSWFAEGHLHYKRLLLTDASAITGGIMQFHAEMREFHRKVLQFNRDLQKNLDASLAFDCISQLTVEVVDTLDEQKYWRTIEDMAEVHQAWFGARDQELPPPEYAQTLRDLLTQYRVREGIRAELAHLIRIQGTVIENGIRRTFSKASDLEHVSSNGLAYIILCLIFVAFINRIRGTAPVEVAWALDELKDLDYGNIAALLAVLRRNHITLLSAFADPDIDVLALFPHRFGIEEGRRLIEVRLAPPPSDPEATYV